MIQYTTKPTIILQCCKVNNLTWCAQCSSYATDPSYNLAMISLCFFLHMQSYPEQFEQETIAKSWSFMLKFIMVSKSWCIQHTQNWIEFVPWYRYRVANVGGVCAMNGEFPCPGFTLGLKRKKKLIQGQHMKKNSYLLSLLFTHTLTHIGYTSLCKNMTRYK